MSFVEMIPEQLYIGGRSSSDDWYFIWETPGRFLYIDWNFSCETRFSGAVVGGNLSALRQIVFHPPHRTVLALFTHTALLVHYLLDIANLIS